MFNAIDEMNLTKDLMIAIGLEIQPMNNTVSDQDTKLPLTFGGKSIKANTDPNKSLYISEYDIKLEPANPKCTKLIEHLFGYFIDKSVADENIVEVQTYFFDRDESSPDGYTKNRLTIRYANGVKWTGNWFYNRILCFVEAIFCMDGTFFDRDLRMFDDPELNGVTDEQIYTK